MTILGTVAIQQAMAAGRIVCDPAPEAIECAHIDVHLGPYYWIFRPRGAVDIGQADPTRNFIGYLADGRISIPPHGLVLAHTQEYVGTAPNSGLLPLLHTRSTFARWGLSVCTANAGLGDIGFSGRWTLEIVNPHSVQVVIPVGARIGAITFQQVAGDAVNYAPGTRYNTLPQQWRPEDMLPRQSNW